ncbi:MAG: PqqD family protein [Thermomicrobiales bacterium]|nr:PqqD family protein [Thermomicrobiales bacterium]
MNQTDSTEELVWQNTPVPAARAIENFSVAEVGDGEYVFFDNERLEYHTLNASAFAVWQLCDGVRTLADIRHVLQYPVEGLPMEALEVAVFELSEAGLINGHEWGVPAPMSRRRAIKIGAASAVGIALLPAVSSITAPVAANTESCTPEGTPVPEGGPCACTAECTTAIAGHGRCCCSRTNICIKKNQCNGNCLTP